MGWSRSRPRRILARPHHHHRLNLEWLENRTVLSSVGSPIADTSSTSTPATDYDSIVGASAARSQYGVDGTGSTVAVIDAGVNYNNEALGAGFGPGHKVIAGYDFSDSGADPIASGLQHGTSVAGLIASDDPSHLGIAPGADIVALRVFDNSNQGDFNKVGDALQWVIDNHTQYNITAVNLSIADGNNYTRDWYANDGGVGERINTLISQLDTLNIPVVTATGNNFSGQQGVGFPAIVPETISVTSTDASGQLVSNAQRLGQADGGDSATDLAAPGDNLWAPADGNNFEGVTGTSFAAPLVSGAIVLMQQVYESRFGTLPTVNQLDDWLQQGADPINDPATGITVGRLDIPKAIALIPTPAAQVLTPPAHAPTSSPTPAPSATPTPQPQLQHPVPHRQPHRARRRQHRATRSRPFPQHPS
jgi:type VI secretion system secreted protein VgrG